MIAKIKAEKDIELKTLHLSAGVRYWEDGEVNGVEDADGALTPCRNGDRWEPVIDLDTGVITNWTKGITANVHYKICDDGIYTIKDAQGVAVLRREDYVPGFFPEDHYGDYLILEIDANGKIKDWPSELDTDDLKAFKSV